MARQLKLQQIDVLIDQDTGEKASLNFDRNTNDFVAIIGTEQVRDVTAQGCRDKARRALKAFRPYVWKPYIFIDEVRDRTQYGSARGRHEYRARISFVFYRIEMAQKQDGRWLERPFLVDGLMDSNLEPHVQYNGETFIPGKEFLDGCRKDNLEDRADGSDIHSGGYGKEQASGSHTILPYTEETWGALKVMHQKLLEFEKQLDSLTKAKDFEKRLFAAAKNLKLLSSKGE